MQKVKTLLERIPAWCRGAVVANIIATSVLLGVAIANTVPLFLKYPWPLTIGDIVIGLLGGVGLHGLFFVDYWILGAVLLTPLFTFLLVKKDSTSLIRLLFVNTVMSIPLGIIFFILYLSVYFIVESFLVSALEVLLG